MPLLYLPGQRALDTFTLQLVQSHLDSHLQYFGCRGVYLAAGSFCFFFTDFISFCFLRQLPHLSFPLRTPALFVPTSSKAVGAFHDNYEGGWQEILPTGGSPTQNVVQEPLDGLHQTWHTYRTVVQEKISFRMRIFQPQSWE